MTYKFKWRRILFQHTRKVIGHKYAVELDKMILYAEDGSIEEISHWKDCSARLGVDWVLATKKNVEKEVGQPVSLKV